MNSPTVNRSARPLLLLLAAFIVPVLLAKLVLSQHWYREGATNQGTLFAEATSYQSLGIANPLPQRWQILYRMPKSCHAACQERLYMLKQAHTALGAEQGRVSLMLMLSPDSDQTMLTGTDFTTAALPNALAGLLNEDALILTDPMGTLVMSYPGVSGREANLSQGKALLADLRKLLKLSRVG
ncbi:hypothetical protein KJI95_11755 [Shewanella sp. JM162201]|uniref:Cytochrome oxidase biogenesis cluster protein n=1 Tax=Shewanella jiangmenensis TaxID=2837387 RepID=A0ABS5V5V0_9GAMM|nr:hypothetical protein [Shewanella jiangmenensis]MBT1445196.1 hypothetical protein [Shewanella jiangmenensis]